MSLEPRPTRFRYVVLTMLILMYAVSYIDRVCIAAVAPGIRAEFGLSPSQLGVVFTSFSVAYALFQIPGGRLADQFGPRRVLAGMASFWGACTLLTAGAWNQSSLLVARFLCGAGESGGFPTASRSIFQWLAPHERGFAQGITHSGARLAGAITPPVAAWLMVQYGWRSAFIVFGLLTFVWVVAWYWLYRDNPGDHPRVNPQELARIRTGSEANYRTSTTTRSWSSLLRERDLLLLAATHFCYVYTFWIFITWFPTYLVETRGVEVTTAGLLAGLPLLAGAVTNTLGGWISDRIVDRRGLRIGRGVVAACSF
ncbi:MAG: MFS transporter, partial [Acidobacteriota bacterium]